MRRMFSMAIFLLLLCPLPLFAQLGMGGIDVYIYPHELTRDDKLVDGPTGLEIRITDNTLLVWVDLLPEALFAHPTAYVLISGDGTRVEEGMWWPVLNGKRILFGERDKYALISHFELYSFTIGDDINIYFFPHALEPGDKLVDGPIGKELEIVGQTLFIWVDLHPDMRFTHETEYVLIAKEEIAVVAGGWWPVLNGKIILYGSKNKVGVISPFVL